MSSVLALRCPGSARCITAPLPALWTPKVGRSIVCAGILALLQIMAAVAPAYATDSSDDPAVRSSGNPPAASQASEDPENVIVRGRRWLFNRDTRYAHSLPEVNGTEITVTRKTSVVSLAAQPTVIDNHARELFDRLPGLILAEQQNPTQLNLSYRGLGNPQESEYLLVMRDRLPLELDWIGYPTLYVLPVPQTIDHLEMIRGGSGLLFGPEPQPAINFVSRAPAAVPWAGTTEQVGGGNGLFSSFNALSGTAGPVDYRASFAHRQSQGERRNGDYRLDDVDAAVGWAFARHQKLTLDLQAYTVTSGLAGLMGAGQFHTDPQRTTTPDDRLWTDNDRLVLTYSNRPDEHDELTQKAWAGYTDLLTRSASYDATLSGTAATLAMQRFHFAGLDGRYRHGWGHGNAVTVGYTAYDSHSPFRQFRSPDPVVSRDDESGRLLYSDQRSTRYAALFAESLLRLPGLHVLTSGRLDYERLRSRESVATHPLLVDRTEGRAVPLFGIGIGNDFGRGNETYLNVAQGYRPLRYLDIASPFSNFAPGNSPDPTRYLTYELGVHGWPLIGLYYDVSLFQVTARDRIEARQLSLTETVDVNTGDTRSRGAELEASWDVLRLLPQSSPRRHLDLFANASLLNAHFTASALPGQTGKVPAYAPRYVLKAGATLRVEPRVKLSLIAESVAAQYFQDSDLPIGTTPARIPGYTVADFSCDVLITPRIRLLGGISNLTDRRYYSRVFISRGLLEPALARSAYAGAAYDF